MRKGEVRCDAGGAGFRFEKVKPKKANRGRLASLRRTLKRDTESEKRRFYAIAKDHGMLTGKSARDAMFEALSEL